VKIVPFGGGLGAQIFGAVVVEHLRGEEGRHNVLGDTSYFLQTPKPAKRGERINIYAWELDYYGIPITRYNNSNPRDASWIERKLGIHARRRLEDGSLERLRALREAMKKNWSDVFPIHAAHERESRKLLEEGNLPTAVVHLRRGDYLNVATHLVSDSDVFPLLRKLARVGIRRFLFASDEPVPLDFFMERVPGVSAWGEIPSEEKFLVHAVMRNADCLVISNSQFSLSAAMLNGQGMVFMPRVWHGGGHAELHSEIHQYCDWLAR
jgi:hypothetical protein